MSQHSVPLKLPVPMPPLPPEAVAILGAIADPVFVQDVHHCWVYANPACGDLLGRSPDSLLGQSHPMVFPPSTLKDLHRAEQKVWATGIPQEHEITLQDNQGEWRIFSVKITPLPAGVEAPNLVSVLRDITHRNRQLRQALEFEATLKRITDRVRDSLDETQILQTAVEELTGALGAKGSNTALYDLEQGTSTIYYEYNDSLPSYQGRVAQMEAFPEVYHQLLAGQYFQFCSREPNPVRGPVAMLACPILDDRGVLGDLWLINGSEYGFNDQEIRLVQQVANQCAIAIRQARLYQAAQSQVKELERLNQLKDDFLSTVSHELRTPVTSMRVALQLLGVALNQTFDLEAELVQGKASENRIVRYYQVLKEECEREISLINDLLDLQRIDGGNHPVHAQTIDPATWLPKLINGFQERAHSRQQTLVYKLGANVPSLVSDLPSLERVFAELLNNACKYTPPGGEIYLMVANNAPGQVQFQVVNSGVEIPPAELPRIFDKFYRVPSADPWQQGGTGLGLALVRKLLWHLGGEIIATSGQNHTCFTVTLPVTLS